MSAQERYDELKAGEDAMDAVDRLRFFCSLAMNGQDWIDVEQYFDGVTAELAALRKDAERYRWLRERINWVDKVGWKERHWTHYDYRDNPPSSEHIDEYIDAMQEAP